MNMQLRDLAIDLLDDEHGINETAWTSLSCILHDEGCEDIADKVEACEGRFYLTKENANILREKYKS